MDFSEAEARFQHQRQHMSQAHLVLALHEQLGTWCKSAYYLALQSPDKHIKIKTCLHEALRVIEEIQNVARRATALPTPADQKEALMQSQKMLEALFLLNDENYNPQEIFEVYEKILTLKNKTDPTPNKAKRRSYIKPPLNVNRSEPL